MKNYLVLNWGALKGEARKIVQQAVHKTLLGMGLTWFEPQMEKCAFNEVDADFWIVGAFMPSDRMAWERLSFAKDFRTVDYYLTRAGDMGKLYNAAYDIDEFYNAVAAFVATYRVKKEVIEGVEVTIIREQCILDATKLIARVQEKANDIRLREFIA